MDSKPRGFFLRSTRKGVYTLTSLGNLGAKC